MDAKELYRYWLININIYNQQTWVLTNLGAVNFITLQHIVRQQQATINALVIEVNKLKQLAEPKQNTASLNN